MSEPTNRNPPHEGRWLTIEEAAERVRVSERTILRWGQCGLRICRRGRVYRIWSCDLDAFVRGSE